MGLVCVNPPALEPVSLSELKEFLRIDAGDTSQDNTIAELAVDARTWCEAFTARRFVQQQWQLLIDFFPGYIDLKIAGAKVSSPFVSGSNAVLVGIRYALVPPYPPVRSIDSFLYQNANGQVTSMIQGPVTIGSVTNHSGQLISLNTTQPHGLVTGASITIAGNAPLLAALGGQPFWNITVTDPSDFFLNGSSGTGATIAGGGTVTGLNYVQDLLSSPARLTPLFGQMWPVARVVVNAVQLSFTVGYAQPITATVQGGQAGIAATGYPFQASDVNRPIWIPGAGNGGLDLNTSIASVSNPPNANATLRDPAQIAVEDATCLLVNAGIPGHWPKIKRGIKILTLSGYNQRLPRKEAEDSVEKLLYPVRDLRR
jgi:hypothetical protein